MQRKRSRTVRGTRLVPLDLLVGMKASKSIVLSLQFDAPLHYHYEQYDAQVEFWIGVFF